MRSTRKPAILLFLLLFPLLLIACRRRGEETPTPSPTVQAATATPSPTRQAVTSTATTEPRPPTVTPIPTMDTSQIDWPPQVVDSWPKPGEETLLDGSITIRFDQPMDQPSVEAALAVIDTERNASIAGEFSWPRLDTVIFTPAGQFERQKSYRVRLGQSAQGRNGQLLRDSVTLQVQTVGYLDVSQVIPAPDTSAIDVDSAITVVFNRPVVPLVSTGQQAEWPHPLSMTPPVNGQGEWVSSSIYRFTPDEPLAGSTTYQLTIAAGLQDVVGGVLSESYAWQFATTQPQLVELLPDNRAENVLPNDPIRLTFNMPMDQASVEAAFAVAPESSLRFDWGRDSRVVSVTHATGWALGQLYRVTLEERASSANSQPIGAPTNSGFTVIPLPDVIEVFPAPGSQSERWQRGVNIRFASPMDIDSLEGNLTIEPEPRRINYLFNEYDFSLHLDFDLERDTAYVITVPASAADPYGNTLGSPYTWRFTTPPHDPLVSLNLPQFGGVSQLSNSYPTDLSVIHRNVSRIDASLYDLDLSIPLIMEPYQVQTDGYSPPGNPLRTWTIEPDAARDAIGIETVSLADGQALPTGVYLVQVDAPEIGQDQRYWQVQNYVLVVADTNLVVKQTFEAVYAWATNLATGQPSAGLDVTLYNEAGIPVASAVTDSDGLVQFDQEPSRTYLDQISVVSNRPGDAGFGVATTQWDIGVSPWQFNISADWGQETAVTAYLYTDRPIYRPGDTIQFRGILRQSAYGRYQLPTQREVTVAMSKLYGFEQNEVTITLSVDQQGNFDGSFAIPEDAELGDYWLFLKNESAGFNRLVTVAEYRKPEFLVEMTSDQAQHLRGEEAAATLKSSYFFGGSAADLEVNWTIYEKPFQLTGVGDRSYSFSGETDYYFYRLGPGGSFAGYFGQPIASGQGKTDANGELVIDLPADLLQDAEPGSREVTVEAVAVDPGNTPVAARTSIVFHAGETYVGVVPQNFVGTAGLESTVQVLTVDWDGVPVPDAAVEIVFYRREWISERVTEFGQRTTRWVPEDMEITRFAGRTNENGEATASFVPELGGSYLVIATVTDSGNRTQSSSTYLWVSDPNFAGWRLDPREKRMDLTPDQTSYDIGQVARLLVQSPFEGPIQAWMTIERGRLLEQRLLTLQGGSHLLEIPILENYAPNVHVTIAAVKGIDDSNQYADMRLGIAELVVPPDRLALDISLEPRAELLQPGDTAIYDIEVTDYAGNPVTADLSLALVDLAVLTLKEDTAPPILEAFYNRQPYRSRIGSGLIMSGEGLEVEIPTQQFGFGGGGGGDGAAAESVALRSGEDEGGADDEIRRDFPDTAFWEAQIRTDVNGQASVEIALPDSLTTWRLLSKAASARTLVGEAQVDVVVTKPLLLRPVTPRFFTVGDVLSLGAIVHNNTPGALDIAVSLEADGLTLDGEASRQLSLPAGANRLVQWAATVDDVRFADLVFRADAGDYRDATKPTFGIAPDQLIPVYRYSAEDIVATAGIVEEDTRVEAILLPPGVDTRTGSVNITLNASLAGTVIDALEAIDTIYPLVCAHSVSDRLLPNAAAARALRKLQLGEDRLAAQLDTLISNGLLQLEQLQKSDGGWGWCYSAESEPYLSAYVLLSIAKAQEAGYGIDSGVYNAGVAYLTTQLKDTRRLVTAGDANRQAFYLYVLAESGESVASDLDALLGDRRDLLDAYAKGLMLLAYHLSGGDKAAMDTLMADLNSEVVVSATSAHWQDAAHDWFNLSSDIRGTAMILSALSQVQPENPHAANAVRWLVTARRAGHWSTGQEDAWSLIALTDWMEASGELDADFQYAVGVNGSITLEGSYDRNNIASRVTTAVPVAALNPTDVNFLAFGKDAGDGRLYYSAHLDSHIDAEAVEATSRGFTVQRAYYDANCDPTISECLPVTTIEAGQQVRVELTVIVPEDRVFAVVEDHLPAGAEAIDPGLETSAQGSSEAGFVPVDTQYRYGYWGWWYFNRIEFRDERVLFYSDFLPAGTYQYSYIMQTRLPGEYQVIPALAREEFFPENFGRSNGFIFEITQ